MVRMAAFLLICSLTFLTCAGFGYKYYKIDLEIDKLIADKASNDLPFVQTCSKQNDKYQCIAMLVDEFLRLKNNYDDLKVDLAACEAGDN